MRRYRYDDDEDNYDEPYPRRRQPRPQLIEQTSKRWKIAQLLGALVTVVGAMVILLTAIAYRDRQDREPGTVFVCLGLAAIVSGIIAFTIARAGAWWEHG